jgi:hypothetical protein
MVRPARFELATYGFEVRAFELSILLIMKQGSVMTRNTNSAVLLIFYVLADFGKVFSHRDEVSSTFID